jgi:hypothetical protein
MTVKKVKNKVAMYLRKNFGVALPDAYKMGKIYAKTFVFYGVDHVLEALAQEASYNKSLEEVMLKYFKLEHDYYYDEYHEEFVSVHNAIPK